MKNANKMVHDLRNPLNTITMTAELGKMLLSQGEAKPSELKELFETIMRSATKAESLLHEWSQQESD